MNKTKIRNLIINLSISFVSIFLSATFVALVMEVRYYRGSKNHQNQTWHDPNTKFDSELGWSPIPNRDIEVVGWGTLSSNSLGFRSAAIDQNKKQIIVLGDSVAWGYGVNDISTFPYFLDKMVSKTNYQVSNLAVSGYDLGQYYLFLKRHINKFNNLKQVVLIICTQNDLICTGRNYDNGKRKPLFIIKNNDLVLTNNNINKHCLRNLFSRSYFLKECWSYNGIVGNLLSYISGDRVLSGNELSQVSIMLLERIYNLVTSHNAKLLVVLSPSQDDFKEKSSSLLCFEHIFSKLKLNNFDYIDYIDFLKETKKLNSLYLDNGHYTKTGNLLLAETVYKYLQKDNLLH